MTTDPVESRLRPVAALFDEMGAAMARNWGWVLLRGVIGIGVGLFALVQPVVTFGLLVLIFAIYSIADGIAAITASIRAMRRDQSWAWLLLQGIVSLAAGVIVLMMPVFAAKVFLYVMGFWAIVGGIVLVIAAFKLPIDHGRWLLAIAGALSVLWGILLLMQPATGALVLTLWFGVYTMTLGIFFTVIAFTLRNRHKQRLAAA